MEQREIIKVILSKYMQVNKDLTERKGWEILNATSDCPFNTCDGKGISFKRNLESNEIECITCKCKQLNEFNMKTKLAKIPTEYKNMTLDSFNTSIYSSKESRHRAELAKAASINFIKKFERFSLVGKGLYICGKVKGSGKTRLAVSIGNALMKVKNANVRFIKSVDLFKEIRQAFNDSNSNSIEILDAFKNIEVLIIDDVGVEKVSDWVNQTMYELLDYRMEWKKVTIFTSNEYVESLNYDERVTSRIEKMVLPIKLPDESVREDIALQENVELVNLLFDSNNEC